MKKLSFICIVSLFATTQTNAQMRDTTLNINTHKVDANSLFQKSIKQKTTAWLLLVGGAGIAVTGFIIMQKDANRYLYGPLVGEHPIGAVVFVAGDALILGSIPFFIASAKNKRKTALMLKEENVFFNPQLNIKDHLIAVGVKINL